MPSARQARCARCMPSATSLNRCPVHPPMPTCQGSGLSDGGYVTLGAHEVEDLEAVVAYLREEGEEGLIVWLRVSGCRGLLGAAREVGGLQARAAAYFREEGAPGGRWVRGRGAAPAQLLSQAAGVKPSVLPLTRTHPWVGPPWCALPPCAPPQAAPPPSGEACSAAQPLSQLQDCSGWPLDPHAFGWFPPDSRAGSTSTIGLWGRSMGAVTALLFSQRDPSVAGMVRALCGAAAACRCARRPALLSPSFRG